MKHKEFIIVFFLLFGVCCIFFYKLFFYGLVPFPGDLLIAEYNPWKTYSFLGYNPGSFPNKAQYFDVLRQLYPWKTAVITLLKQGVFPLWNPFNFSGAPLFANFQSAVLYPLNILYFLLPQQNAWSFLVVLQTFVASVSTYSYARKVKISVYGSFLAAISFAYSYYMSVWLEYNTVGHVLAWFPLLLLASECLLENKKPHWLTLFIFSFLAMIFAGHIQVAIYAILFVFVYVACRRKFSIREYGFFMALFVISTCIGTVQLLPGFELVGVAARSIHPYDMLVNKILIQPYQMLMMLIPDIFGNPATRNYLISDTYVGKVTSIGLVGVVAAFFSFFNTKEKIIKYYIFASAVLLVLITKNPITSFLYIFNIPFISSSSPTLGSFLLAFSFSMLAGFGIDYYFQKLTKAQLVKTIVIFLGFFVIAWTCSFFGNKLFNDELANAFVNSKKIMLYETGIFLLVSIILLLGIHIPRFRKYIIILLIIVNIFELWRGFNKFNPFVPKELVFPPVAVFQQIPLSIDRFWGYGLGNIEANFATQYQIYSPEGYDPLYPKWYGQLLYATREGKLLNKFDTNTRSDAIIAPSANGLIADNTNRLKLLNLLGVKYILDKKNTYVIDETYPASFEKIYTQNEWRIYKNNKSQDRIFLAGAYEVCNSTRDFERKFFSSSFDPSQTILLENPLSKKIEKDPAANLQIVSYSSNKIVVKTNSTKNQLLFVSDTFYPGWKGTIDNRETAILKADYSFRAMEVPSGSHYVVMEYKPQSVQMGIYISLVGGILAIILCTYTHKRGIIQ